MSSRKKKEKKEYVKGDRVWFQIKKYHPWKPAWVVEPVDSSGTLVVQLIINDAMSMWPYYRVPVTPGARRHWQAPDSHFTRLFIERFPDFFEPPNIKPRKELVPGEREWKKKSS